MFQTHSNAYFIIRTRTCATRMLERSRSLTSLIIAKCIYMCIHYLYCRYILASNIYLYFIFFLATRYLSLIHTYVLNKISACHKNRIGPIYMRTMCTRVVLVNDSLAAWHSKQYARNTRNTCCVLLRTRTRIRAVFFRRHPCRINNNNKYMYICIRTYVCDIFLYFSIYAHPSI